MNKTELLEKVAAKVPDVSWAKLNEVFNAITDTIGEALEAKDNVKIANFGTFDVKHVAEREGHSPATGEKITIAARDKVTFKVSNALHERVNK